jgi:hypothetical protein
MKKEAPAGAFFMPVIRKREMSASGIAEKRAALRAG